MKTRVIQDEPDDDRRKSLDLADQHQPQHHSGKGTPMSGLVSLMKRHRIVSFFVLTYAIAWCCLPLSLFGVVSEMIFIAVAPLVSALIVIGVTEGKAGFRDLGSRMIRWRVAWYWYVVALGLPLVVKFGSAAVNAGVSDAPAVDFASLSWTSFAAAFALRLVNPMDGPLGEEPGFRGFAIPRMQAVTSPLVTAVILGVLVAGWHTPLIFGENVGPVGLVTTFVITLVYVWLFNRTGGSVLLTLLFHNMQGAIQVGEIGYSGADVERQILIECVAWSVVAVAVLVGDRAAWRTASPKAVFPEPQDPSATAARPVTGSIPSQGGPRTDAPTKAVQGQ
jgi:uncharacterized protein